MKYAHPDVLDNGPAYIRSSATRALLLPAFTAAMSYAEALASALISTPVSTTDFVLSNEGTGRKLVFGGATGTATSSLNAGAQLHVAITDGASRILWASDEASHRSISAGQAYLLPSMTYLAPQLA